jgi:hypothetical protein
VAILGRGLPIRPHISDPVESAAPGSVSGTAAGSLGAVDGTVAAFPTTPGTGAGSMGAVGGTAVGVVGPAPLLVDSWTGTDGTEWDPAKWKDIRRDSVYGGATTATDAFIVGNRGRMTASGAGEFPSHLAAVNMAPIADVEILISWKWEAPLAFDFGGNGVMYRVQDPTAPPEPYPEHGYVFGAYTYEDGDSNVSFGYYTDLVFTELWIDDTVDFYDTTERRVRIQAFGNRHRGRWWNVGDTEPTSWHWDLTDTTYPDAGSIDLSWYAGEAGAEVDSSWDDFAVYAYTPEGTGTASGSMGSVDGTIVGTRSTTGTAAGSLGAVTATIAAVRTTFATVAGTLGSVDGTVAAFPTTPGTAAGSLGALGGTAVATITVVAVAAGSLGALNGTAVAASGSASGSMGALGGTALGDGATPVISGVAAGALGAVVGTVAGGVTVFATAAGALGAVTGTVAASRTTFGSGVASVGAIAATADAIRTVPAVTSGTLGAINGAGLGAGATPTVNGTAAGSLGAVGGSSAGIVSVIAAGLGLIGAISGAASGIVGAGAATLTASGTVVTVGPRGTAVTVGARATVTHALGD